VITGTVQLSGRVKYAPPAQNIDGSSNPAWVSDVLESMACSGRTESEYTLVVDGDAAVSFGALAGVNLIIVKVAPNAGIPPSPGFPNGVPSAPNPVTVKLTGGAGAAAISVDPFLYLISAGVPYTAMSIARAPGVQTVVRVQLFAFGS
jgi:hypothetical protein